MPTASPASPAAEMTAALKQAWRAGTPPDAAGAVRACPDLLAERSLVVELAYEEYCLREEAGAAPDPASFCRRFPTHRTHIREVLDGHRLLADHPELFGPPAGWPAVGDEVFGLVLVKELGRGAFARAYLARDPEAGDRPVVLKLAPGRTSEGRTLGPIAHPNVVGVLWAKPADGMQAVCMPYTGAATLRDAVEAAHAAGRPTTAALLKAAAGGPPPAAVPPAVVPPGWAYPRAVAAILGRLADAVAHLHRTGVCHGDLKPSNVILAPGGHPYLIDFNLAAVGPADALRRGGTLPYMAPELLRTVAGIASEPIDGAAADVYAFGAVLFEAVTGRVPVAPPSGAEPTAAAVALLQAGPARASARRAAGVPRPLARLIDACLHPDPAVRPAMADVRDRLTAFAVAPVRRRRAALGLAVGLAVGGAGWWAVSRPLAAVADREPSTPAEHLERGLKHLRAGNPEAAHDHIETARRARNDGPTHAYAGYCQQLFGAPRSAADRYAAAIDQFGFTPAWARANRAYALLKAGPSADERRVALLEANEAVRLAPGLRPARLVRGAVRAAVWRAAPGGPPDPELVADVETAAAAPGPTSAELYQRLAVVQLAFTARRDEDLDRVVHSLQTAVERGFSPAALGRDPLFRRHLGGRPHFDQLVGRPEPSFRTPSDVDPFVSPPPDAPTS